MDQLHLKQHKTEFAKFQEDTKLEEVEKKEKNEKRKHEELSNGIGVSSNFSQSAKRQPKMIEAVNKMMKYDINGPTQTKFDEAVLELLAVNCLPFELANSPEFKSLVHLLDKRITVKDRKTYQRKIKNLATAVLSKIKKMINLHCDISCAITSDIWSSRSQDGYISGTLHLIDEKFRLNWILECTNK